MDISFNQESQKFNYRVCAMIISGNKILAMHDERSPYFYLPGGRVKMGETAEQAVVREIWEELGVKLKIARPLWLNQAFFTEEVENSTVENRSFQQYTICTGGKGGKLHFEVWKSMWKR